ncbi:MAG: ribonuclease HI family protein [Candidatus Aenigmarchaeota archaeon]|nr:ribonuclease HI family protein [Candidatus Aenigmarchaeota archaeon]
MTKEFAIYTDAGARGNPGPAAIAVLFFEGSKLVKQHGEYIGKATNNQAEYRAIIKGLELAHSLGKKELELFTDSELVARQLSGKYKVKDAKLKPLYEQAKAMEKKFEKVSYSSVSRGNLRIWLADKLVNKILDSEQRKKV